MSVLAALKEDGYQFGNCAAILYDRNRADLFPEGYLGELYRLSQQSGITDTVFGGNPESHYDAIVGYLAPRPLIVVGMWEGSVFHPMGYAFIQLFCGNQDSQRAPFCGYGFFREVWGTEEINVLMMLGLAHIFEHFSCIAIHGIRYESNVLTKRFTERFGFNVVGEIPYYQLKRGKLVPGIVSTLLRSDFEKYVESFLLEQYRGESIVIGTEQHPAIEEAEATINAQMERLQSGEIPVVFLPAGSKYLPYVPDGVQVVMAEDVSGAGVYFYREELISRDEILRAAAEGTQGRLLGHVEEKREIVSGPTVVVRALAADGTLLQDSLVSATADAIAAQVEEFLKRFPDCKWDVKRPEEVLSQRIGQKGGQARASKLSPERRKEIAQKAAAARWGKESA